MHAQVRDTASDAGKSLLNAGKAFGDAAGKVVSAVVSAAGDVIDFAKAVCQAR